MDRLKTAAIAAVAAGAASYVLVSTATCYATEPADIEPMPLGATFTTTIGTTSSSAITIIVPNTMGDEPIKVDTGVPDRRGVLAPRKWGTRSPL
jgi:hypothetical protein